MSERILIEPWEGKQYQSAPFGRRLMLLGESMYTSDSDESPAQLLKQLITWVAEGATKWRFYGRVFQVMTGTKRSAATVEEVNRFWQSVLFHQYIQDPIRGGPRDRPSAAMWAAAPDYLRKIIETHQPEAIIVFGKGVWGNLCNSGFIQEVDSEHRLKHGEHQCSITFLNHPGSNGFSPSVLHANTVAPFLKRIRG